MTDHDQQPSEQNQPQPEDSQPESTSEIYAIEDPDPQAPNLPGTVVVRKDEEDLHAALGAELMVHATNCVRTFGDFHLALSGGGTPMPFYRRLMVDPALRSIPWDRTHLWIVDERRVPEDHEKNNFAQIRDLLVDHSDIPKDNVHPMPVMDDDADVKYEKELQQCLAWREKGQDRLDFVLLGMGDDAHTASLFPGSAALHAPEDRLIVINEGEGVTPPDRVTMTYKLINGARYIAVLVAGAKKQATIERISKEHASGSRPMNKVIEEMPILGVKPVGGVLLWYLDHAACG